MHLENPKQRPEIRKGGPGQEPPDYTRQAGKHWAAATRRRTAASATTAQSMQSRAPCSLANEKKCVAKDFRRPVSPPDPQPKIEHAGYHGSWTAMDCITAVIFSNPPPTFSQRQRVNKKRTPRSMGRVVRGVPIRVPLGEGQHETARGVSSSYSAHCENSCHPIERQLMKPKRVVHIITCDQKSRVAPQMIAKASIYRGHPVMPLTNRP